MDALERTTNLLALLLESRQWLTMDQIVNELSGQYPANPASRRGAFERDKQLLREIGVPIDTQVLGGSQAGQTAYRIDRTRYELADLTLEADERRALQLAVAAVRSSDATFGLLKLGEEAAGPTAVHVPLPELDVLPALRQAAVVRAETQFEYHGTPRRLAPYSLLLRRGYWYVIGLDLDRGEVRTYRADRIAGDVVSGPPAAFTRPADFDPLAAFPADPKELGGAPAEALVHVDARWAASVEREIGAAAVRTRFENGAIVVAVPCANVDAFRSWVLGLGTGAEVLGPSEVRAAVVDWLRAMAAAGRG
jgi:predicted DNA-binding transcriptional regulator YafY